MFAGRPEGQGAIVVQDGATIEDFKVRVVDSETVMLVGPKGALTLVLQQGAGARGPFTTATPLAPPATLESETAQAGASVGLLAIERDTCARAGHLPGVRADSEQRLRLLIQAIARAPKPAPSHKGAAPVQLIALGLGAGLDAAHLQSANFVAGNAACADLQARWKEVAGRYGLL